MRVEHIAFNVEDPQAMCQWYCEHLGMRVAMKAEKAYFLSDETGHGIIEIYNNPPDQVPDYPAMDPLLLHLAFRSEDLLKDHQRLVAAGAAPEKLIPTADDQYGVFFLRDPWGFTIQLVRREQDFLP